MKMDNTSRLIAAGIGAVTLALWLILPVYSFTFVIPLFMINGIMLAFNVNQLGIVLLLFPLLMILAPLTGEKKFAIGAGALTVVMCIVAFLLRKTMIVRGNLGWLFKTASLLISNLGSFANVTITEANIDSYITLACDNFLMGGLGLWLSMIASVIYIVFVLTFSQETMPKASSTSAGGQQNGNRSGYTSGASKGFSHRT